ncbi:glycoside hydrolase family 3 protein [Schizophyllum commune Loenen D]|nr:glycoside hydrolase family 3 protein [Schizophyllum commune Loenen D]
MPPSDFKNADIEQVVEQLTTDESILLTAGVGFWHTHAVPRLGIPQIKVSDGPNGVRGNHFWNGTPAKCLPSATALGATFNTELVEEVGLRILSEEAKRMSVSALLGPTCNIQRNPLGGRSFESFSEDPYLSGHIAAAYVRGVQAGGIATTIKHFVGNDKEDDRFGSDSVMSQRALREIYLMPFMLAQKHAQPWSYMTAYNRVNGTHVSENPFLLKRILREEWGFNGMTMSDWFGVSSIDASLNAGLDLEMPGTDKWRTLNLVNRAINTRKVTKRTVKERAREVLKFVKRCAEEAPEVLDRGDKETTETSDADVELMRRLAGESIVLLKNEGNLLPLQPKQLKKVAILGGNAKAFVISGGGSASLKPSYFTSPYDGIVTALKDENPDVQVTYSEGATAYLKMPSLDYDIQTDSGERGWTGHWFQHTEEESMTPKDTPFLEQHITETSCFFSLSVPKGLTRIYSLKLKGVLKPRPYDCTFKFGLISAGRAKLFVDGKQVIDNWTRQRRGQHFFTSGSEEEYGTIQVKANAKHKILVEFCNVRAPADGDEDEMIMDFNAAVRLGGSEVEDADVLLENAVGLAKEADVAIVVVGTNGDWETEGNDRTSLELPGRTNELIARVAEVNKKTIVVTQSGSVVTLPWTPLVPSMVHAWYLGNATGEAIADVLVGRRNPSGKLSLTFPVREQDVPSYGHFHTENGVVRYAEDLYVGYKHYVHRDIKPQFAFGHGLTYTSFSLSNLKVAGPISDPLFVTITVTVKNTGPVAGAEVAQAYLSYPTASTSLSTFVDVTHPPLQLRAFSKVFLQPGESKEVSLTLDRLSLSYWHEIYEKWVVEKGEYTVRVGTGVDKLDLEGRFTVNTRTEWSGI